MAESWTRRLGAGDGRDLHLHDPASQFRSFMQPVALMSSLPLTLIGVVGALLLFGLTRMNLFSIIGVVMLMGLVTKNAILLIDFAIRARAGEVHLDDDGGYSLAGGSGARRRLLAARCGCDQS
ncbi:MAG: efflux RND transporter permease subunit [Sphaerotilus natans]